MTDYTPILHLPQVAPNQEQKEATINTAFAILEAAMNDAFSVNVAAGNVTLTQDEFTRYFLFQIAAVYISPATRTLTVPATPRWFAVENQTDTSVTVTTGAGGALTVDLASGKIALIVSDGADLRAVVPDPTSGLGLLTDLSDVTGAPTNGQLLRYVSSVQEWQPWTLTLAFSQLSDFPGAYSANANSLLAVKADGSGLEWVSSAANVNSFIDLDDVPSNYTGAANRTVKVNSGATGLVFAQPRLTEAIDFPSSYTGHDGKFAKVSGTAIAFAFPVVGDLDDGPGAPAIGDATKYIRVNVTGDGLEYATGTGGPQTFLELSDTPADYTGDANKLVRVNGAADALVFDTLSYLDLEDGPSSYASQGNKFLRVNSGATAVTFATAAIQDLSNGPGTPSLGLAKRVLRVNAAGTAIEYHQQAITDLLGFPTAFTGAGGKFLQVKLDESGVQFVNSSVSLAFLDLTDTPANYSGAANKLVTVNGAGNGLVFVTPPTIPTLLGHLADVETGTGTPSQGAYLRWTDGVWQAEPGSNVGNLNDLTDVTLTTPAEGQVMVYRSGQWVNEDADLDAGFEGAPSYGAHAYWRVLLHSNNGGTSHGINELEFRNTRDGTNLATGGTPIASSEASGQPASGAFNGSLTGARWDADTATDGEWLGYHFASPQTIRYVSIAGAQDDPPRSPNDFDLQYSDDGSAWTTAFAVIDQIGWAATQYRQFHGPVDLFLTDLADAPSSYFGHAQELLRVKADASGIEFASLSLTDLEDVETGTGTPAENAVLTRKDGVWQPEFITLRLTDLIDVETGTGTPSENAVLTWKNGVWQPEPAAGGGGGGTLEGLSDVNPTVTPPLQKHGRALTWDADSGKWVPGIQFLPSAHAYWRVLVNASQGGTTVSTATLRFYLDDDTTAEWFDSGVWTYIDGNTDAGSTPDNAFDGDIGTSWISNALSGGDTYIGIHFTERVRSVRSIDWRMQSGRTDGPTDFEVQFSDNGTTWTTAWRATSPANWTGGTVRDFVYQDDSAHNLIRFEQLAGVKYQTGRSPLLDDVLVWFQDGSDSLNGYWTNANLSGLIPPVAFTGLSDVFFGFYGGLSDRFIQVEPGEFGVDVSDIHPKNLRTYPETGAHTHWRIAITDYDATPAAAENIIEIAYMEFRPLPNGTAHDFTGGTALGSTPRTGHTLANAFDPNDDSYVSDAVPTGGSPVYLGYEFTAPVHVQEVMVSSGREFGPVSGMSPYAFDVEYSDDGSTWTTAFSVTSPFAWPYYTDHVFSDTPTAAILSLRGLYDVPHSYIGHGLKALRVNAAETGAEFVDDTVPLHFFHKGATANNEVLTVIPIVQSLTLADEFAGAEFACITNPTATTVLSVLVNGSAVGSISITSGGVATFATTATTVALVAGDVLRVDAPASADATLADFGVTFKAART